MRDIIANGEYEDDDRRLYDADEEAEINRDNCVKAKAAHKAMVPLMSISND